MKNACQGGNARHDNGVLETVTLSESSGRHTPQTDTHRRGGKSFFVFLEGVKAALTADAAFAGG